MKSPARLYSLIDKAVYDYSMIEQGDRILIGASGGKDSTLLIEYLALRAKQPRSNYTIKAVNIQSDFAPPFPDEIKKMFYEWNVPFETVKADILGEVKAGHKMNCWWCSSRRRGELLNIALKEGFNKIALGHHLDDILATALMNALEKGELSTMPPNFAYDKYPVHVIRPLCYVCEKRIKEDTAIKGRTVYTCTCGYQNNSARKTARSALDALTQGDEQKKMKLFQALRHIRTEYLP